MALTRSQTIVSSVLLVIVMVTAVSMCYREMTGKFEDRRRENQLRADAAQPHRKTTILDDRVVLIKDEGVTLGRTRLVYTGLADGSIHIALYLLDLEPSYPYPRRITKEEARKGIQLGPRRYRLYSVNSKSLVLLFAD